MADPIADHLSPQWLSRLVQNSKEQEFLDAHGRTTFLLVQLDPEQPELRAGLTALDGTESATLQPSPSVLGYDTVAIDIVPGRGLSQLAGLRSPGSDPATLRRQLERVDHFAVELRKRAGDAYADRISVGRARNKDVVLRAESVSKFHAWFEMDEDQRFYVADADSVNGTRIDGRLLEPRELTPVPLGSVLEFGTVHATLCAAEVLWRAGNP